tara:strand:- start:25 stop:600 length:576 start_codon:yes stop_codon:yes gene_type:complete
MIISFTGPQNSGKTTLIDECKKEFRDKFVYIQGITRDVLKRGLELNEQGDDIAQLFIINGQLNAAYQKNSNDVIIDRSILDVFVYTSYQYESGKISKWVYEYCEKIYDKIIDRYDILFYCDPNIPFNDDGIRSTNKFFRDAIAGFFEYKINSDKRLKGKVIRLYGDINNRMNIIKSVLQYQVRESRASLID